MASGSKDNPIVLVSPLKLPKTPESLVKLPKTPESLVKCRYVRFAILFQFARVLIFYVYAFRTVVSQLSDEAAHSS